uniref:BED-type domain-containing protein n=1 Tax=Cacopsylla melanoneura TaxID=428564 RepID=A0A8D8VDY4_9HEMI
MSEQKSKTWNYFNKIDKDSAKCTVCEKVISTKGRTSKGLTVHLKTIHKIDPKIQEDEEGIQFAESSRAGTSRAGTSQSFAEPSTSKSESESGPGGVTKKRKITEYFHKENSMEQMIAGMGR